MFLGEKLVQWASENLVVEVSELCICISTKDNRIVYLSIYVYYIHFRPILLRHIVQTKTKWDLHKTDKMQSYVPLVYIFLLKFQVLIHCQVNTLLQCMKNLLSSFTRHRHIIHAGEFNNKCNKNYKNCTL